METVQENSLMDTVRPILTIDEKEVHNHLDELVRSSVEQTLNQLLDAEADELCGAKRYEHSAERLDTRMGRRTRSFHTKAGVVELQVPRLRVLPFETQIIERHRPPACDAGFGLI